MEQMFDKMYMNLKSESLKFSFFIFDIPFIVPQNFPSISIGTTIIDTADLKASFLK